MSASSAARARSAASNFTSAVRREVAVANENRRHIQLRGLPRTAMPSDIQKAILRGKLSGVSDVHVDYHRFQPSGRAYLTLTSSESLNQNLQALQNATIASLPITAVSSPQPSNIPRRARGSQGRAEAAERGIITGNGPRGGLLTSGVNVVLWGLPGKMTSDALRMYLQNYRLAGTEGGKKEFVKIELPDSVYSRCSKHLIRMSSVSEAHRLVRALHMTHFEPKVHKDKYLVRARVVY